MAHPNEDLIRRMYAAFGTGDTDTLVSHWTPDVTWHQPGHHPLAGSDSGPGGILGFFGKIFEVTGGTFRATVEHGAADDELGYAQQAVSAVVDGEEISGHDVLVMRFEAGKIAELWLHPFDATVQERMFA